MATFECTPCPVDFSDGSRAAAEAEARRCLQAMVPESVREACTVRVEVAEGHAARELVLVVHSGAHPAR
jgi:hypothetical protein